MKLHHLVISLALSSAAAVAKDDARDPMTALSFESAISAIAMNVAGIVLGGEGGSDPGDNAFLEAAQRRDEEQLELAQSQRAAIVGAMSANAVRVASRAREW